jgi:catechol 2,3-dioxygenase-like lactoylglutathione lyase family enzyme
MNKIGHLSILVASIDDAKDFYVNKLGFKVTADNTFGTLRWLSVSAPDQKDFEIVFVPADTKQKKERVGSQAGEHIFLTLQTDDCKRDYELFKSRGVIFFGEPKKQLWGTEVIFEDLYGNRFDLIQRA